MVVSVGYLGNIIVLIRWDADHSARQGNGAGNTDEGTEYDP